jgi:hypothetical protein
VGALLCNTSPGSLAEAPPPVAKVPAGQEAVCVAAIPKPPFASEIAAVAVVTVRIAVELGPVAPGEPGSPVGP